VFQACVLVKDVVSVVCQRVYSDEITTAYVKPICDKACCCSARIGLEVGEEKYELTDEGGESPWLIT